MSQAEYPSFDNLSILQIIIVYKQLFDENDINNQTFAGSFKAFGFAAPFIYHLKITNNHVNMQDIVLNVSFL